MSSQVVDVVGRVGTERAHLLEVLRQLQGDTNYLSEQVLVDVATTMDIPLSHVYGVASFYSLYSTEPKGRYIIRICENAPCHIDGAVDVIHAFKDELGIDLSETTDDGLFSLELTSCLGVCGVAPAVMVNDVVYGNVTPESVRGILEKYRQ